MKLFRTLAPWLAATLLPASAWAQDAGTMVNDWMILKSPARHGCLATSAAGDTTFGFLLGADGKLMIMMNNANWKLRNRQGYVAKLSLDAQATTDPARLTGFTEGVPKPMLAGPAPIITPNKFKTSDMLYVRVEELGINDTYNITDGAKIWAALQSCAAGMASQ